MTEPGDRLDHLRQQLAELDDAPLSTHPEVLEQTHRALVEELERLEDLDDVSEPGTAGSPPGTAGSSHDDGGPAR